MHITIIGASAGIGLETVKKVLVRDHKVTTLYSDFARVLIKVQEEVNIQVPFIIVTGFGAGESGNYNTWLAKMFHFQTNRNLTFEFQH